MFYAAGRYALMPMAACVPQCAKCLFPHQKVLIPPSKKAKPNCLSVINKRSSPFQFYPNWKVLERFCGRVTARLSPSLRCKTQHIVGVCPCLMAKTAKS